MLLKELVARTLVIGALSYFILDGYHISPDTAMGHIWVGGVGAVGSMISDRWVEPMLPDMPMGQSS